MKDKSVNIRLSHGYSIQSDKLNWILMLDCNGRLLPQGYYGDLSTLLQDYIARCSRSSNAESIQQLLDFEKELITSLNIALQPLEITINHQINSRKAGGIGNDNKM